MANVLRVGYVDYRPMYTVECGKKKHYRLTAECGWPGLGVEIIQFVAEAANMTLEPVFLDPGYPEPWQWVYDAILNKTIDTAILTYEETDKRKMFFNFSVPLYTSLTQLAVRRSDSSFASIFDFFFVFAPSTWITLCASLIIFAFFGIAVHVVEYKVHLSKRADLSDIFWRLMRLQMLQSNKLEFQLKSGSLALVIFALLQCAIILSLYQSYIISSVVRHKNPKPFKSDELLYQLRTKKYSLISISKFDWIYEKLHTTSEIAYYEYRKTLEYNPMTVVKTEVDALELANAAKHIVVFQDDDYISYVITNYCDLVFLDSPFPPQYQRLIFHPEYPHQEIINAAIEKQSMFIERAHRKYTAEFASDTCKRKGSPIALSIKLYFGVMILFICGVLLASMAFGFECLYKRRKKVNEDRY